MSHILQHELRNKTQKKPTHKCFYPFTALSPLEVGTKRIVAQMYLVAFILSHFSPLSWLSCHPRRVKAVVVKLCLQSSRWCFMDLLLLSYWKQWMSGFLSTTCQLNMSMFFTVYVPWNIGGHCYHLKRKFYLFVSTCFWLLCLFLNWLCFYCINVFITLTLRFLYVVLQSLKYNCFRQNIDRIYSCFSLKLCSCDWTQTCINE